MCENRAASALDPFAAWHRFCNELCPSAVARSISPVSVPAARASVRRRSCTAPAFSSLFHALLIAHSATSMPPHDWPSTFNLSARESEMVQQLIELGDNQCGRPKGLVSTAIAEMRRFYVAELVVEDEIHGEIRERKVIFVACAGAAVEDGMRSVREVADGTATVRDQVLQRPTPGTSKGIVPYVMILFDVCVRCCMYRRGESYGNRTAFHTHVVLVCFRLPTKLALKDLQDSMRILAMR